MEPTAIGSLHGHKIKNSSQRYQLFARDEKTCVCCGAKASFWALQYGKNDKSDVPAHLNLYGLSDGGEIALFTKDHKLPRSMGGLDELNNYQVMCQKCNSKKDNDVNWEELGIETRDYLVEVELIDGKGVLLGRKSMVVEANNEDNAKGIACKKTRKGVPQCVISNPLIVSLA